MSLSTALTNLKNLIVNIDTGVATEENFGPTMFSQTAAKSDCRFQVRSNLAGTQSRVLAYGILVSGSI